MKKNPHPFHRHGISFLKASLFLSVTFYVGKCLVDSFSLLDRSILVFRFAWITAGLLLILPSPVAGAFVYKYVYRQLAAPLSLPEAFVLLTLPAVGKYMPGKILSLAGHAVLARTFGVETSVACAAIIVLTLTALAAALLFGFMLIPIDIPDGVPLLPVASAVSAAGIVLMVLIHHRSRKRFHNSFPESSHDPSRPIRISVLSMGIVSLGMFVQVGLLMTGVCVVTMGFVSLPLSAVPAFVGMSCLSGVAGFLALFAPAGIGVREGLLLAMLTPVAGAGSAAMVTVLSRLIQTVLDALLGCTGFVVLRKIRNKLPSPAGN